ncbi:MAG: protein translocase subunit SecF, partial [Saprospiraceae bacterium]|nr:protein translocase subunit SecF [Saprospiraceae bacterium]
MEVIGKTSFDFMGKRKLALVFSALIIAAGIASLVAQGLNFGIDFTGGTLVEVSYHEPVDIGKVRADLGDGGVKDAQVQYFGTAKDIMVRLQVSADKKAAQLSAQVMQALRRPYGEILTEAGQGGGAQQCAGDGGPVECKLQMRRVEFVGPQVGEELTEQGGLAMLYALIGILIYVAWRFEWRFAVGSVVALVHDVLVTIGMFSILQMEFSLPVLAAILAVIGYSLNDTIVVFDRIRENFRKMRKSSAKQIMNESINQTLRRTVLTSVTTLLVLLALFFLGGEVIRGFAAALIIGVIIGTYSSIFVASPLV